MPGANRAWRPRRARSPSTASMITTGSVRGKCSRAAGRAVAPVAADLHRGRGAADGAEAVAEMPVAEAPRLRHGAEIGRADAALDGERAEVDDPVGAFVERDRVRERHREPRAGLGPAEEDHRSAVGGERLGLRGREGRVGARSVLSTALSPWNR